MDYKEKILAEIKEIIEGMTKEGKWTALFDDDLLYHLAIDLEYGVYEKIKQILATMPSEKEIAKKLYQEWQQEVSYTLQIEEGELFDVWLEEAE